jgi:uncharacterized protein
MFVENNNLLNSKPLSSVLIKPAGPDCNLACQYCFYLKKSSQFGETQVHRMSDEILWNITRQIMEQGADNISIAWQGGEPTLMGLSFFKKALTFQDSLGNGKIVYNSLQTNGILINHKWADFFKENNWLVGLSIDGTRHIHDNYRKNRAGKGTWNIVSEKARLLLENQVEVNALVTVNSYSVQFPGEIYDFLKEIGFRYMQFIPIVEFDNKGKAKAYTVNPEDFGVFLCHLFDRWISDLYNAKIKTYVRYFESIFYRYVDFTPPDCIFGSECGTYLVIEHNGDVFSCDFFVEPKWKLGNVITGRLIDMLNSPGQSEFGAIKASLPDTCLACQWLPYCYGGCTKDRRFVSRYEQPFNYLCESTKIFLKHAHPRLQQLASDWKKNAK